MPAPPTVPQPLDLLAAPKDILVRRQQEQDQSGADPFVRASTLLGAQDNPYGGALQYGAQPQREMPNPYMQGAPTFGRISGGEGDIGRFMSALRTVESGGNYTVRNGIGASGAYQFMDSTWGNYGGYKSANQAPPAVQDARAKELMGQYYKQFGDWRLVAAAWIGGPGIAQRIANGDTSAWNVSDGNMTVRQYADKVFGGMGLTTNQTGALGQVPQQAGWQGLKPIASHNTLLVLGRFPTLRFTSGYRDPVHNAEVGGVPNSAHLSGMAVDLVGSAADMQAAANFATAMGGHPLIHDAGSGIHLHITWT